MWVADGRHVTCTLQGSPFSVYAHVGHEPLFLVLAGGGDSFQRSAVTREVFVYGACCLRVGIGGDFSTTACFVVSVCVFIYCLCSLYNFYLFKFVYGFSNITGLF
jgi:hypothetical protein